MQDPHGSFIWYELLTPDTDAAGRFYAAVLGWQAAPHEGDVAGYSIFTHGAAAIGGMMTAPDGVRPGWLGYIGVDDVDAAVAGVVAAGGTVPMPARDLPQVGRIAMVADPQGAPFYLMRGASDQASTAFDLEAPGHCAWNELAAREMDAAVAFYAGAFGWRRGENLPMGGTGGYQLMQQAGQRFGAIMTAPPGMPAMWRFYFRVPTIGAAAERVRQGGGAILHGPQEVPGGEQILIGTDPQGATFALVGKPG
jgi:predicted enzyme related to lactoylglutathione lyase